MKTLLCEEVALCIDEGNDMVIITPACGLPSVLDNLEFTPRQEPAAGVFIVAGRDAHQHGVELWVDLTDEKGYQLVIVGADYTINHRIIAVDWFGGFSFIVRKPVVAAE